jgi:hypothetical protein
MNALLTSKCVEFIGSEAEWVNPVLPSTVGDRRYRIAAETPKVFDGGHYNS